MSTAEREVAAYQTGFATGYSAGYTAASQRPQSCPIDVARVAPALSNGLLDARRTQTWAPNNVETADRTFQYGVDAWMHRFLALEREVTRDEGPPRLTYVPVYASYIHIFYGHLKARAAHRYERLRLQRGVTYVVPHTHPGSCDGHTDGMLRLQVDNDLCRSKRYVPVPYVVSHPAWLVARTLPPRNRTRLLYFRGHLPKAQFDATQTRRKLLDALAREPGVRIEGANTLPGASYLPHDAYVEELLASTFCLAPRGDTASSKRLYEALAAGCIPVIVSDTLELPFARQFDWTRLSVRVGEAEAAAAPHALVRRLRTMPPQQVAAMQRYLLRHREAFLWHEDATRLSAPHYIRHELCAWAQV